MNHSVKTELTIFGFWTTFQSFRSPYQFFIHFATEARSLISLRDLSSQNTIHISPVIRVLRCYSLIISVLLGTEHRIFTR